MAGKIPSFQGRHHATSVRGTFQLCPFDRPLVLVLQVGYPSMSFNVNFSNFWQSQSSDGSLIGILEPANGTSSCEEAELSN